MDGLEGEGPAEAPGLTAERMIFTVAARVLLAFALLVALHMFLRGHDLPGGGFVAGLIAALALIMQYMGGDLKRILAHIRIDFWIWIGIGVVIAGLTGLASVAAGLPFLTSGTRRPVVPLLGEIPLVSAMGRSRRLSGRLRHHASDSDFSRTSPTQAVGDEERPAMELMMASESESDVLPCICCSVGGRSHWCWGCRCCPQPPISLFCPWDDFDRVPPIVAAGAEDYADQLPQALLTAIVIGFGMTGFIMALAARTRHQTGSDHGRRRPVPGAGATLDPFARRSIIGLRCGALRSCTAPRSVKRAIGMGATVVAAAGDFLGGAVGPPLVYRLGNWPSPFGIVWLRITSPPSCCS